MTDYIGYEALTQAAMRGVVREALRETARNKTAPGEHHFPITVHYCIAPHQARVGQDFVAHT